MVKEPTVISTFAGCGGSSLGYKWAGFRELLAIDFDDNAVETFKLNFPEVPCWKRDIREVTGAEIMAACHIKPGDLDVLDGSPPCQGFSTAGKRKVLDPRNDLFREYVRLIKELQPKVFVMENVSGMVKGIMKGRFIEIMKDLKSTGYNVKAKMMNAKWYEVPQSRERMIFIGVKDGDPSFPKPTGKVITANSALGRSTRFVAGSYNKKSYKSGHNRPFPTITKNGISAFSHDKNYSIEDAKTLSSFPKEFQFKGNFQQQWARIGNAVMPRFMYHIAKNIKENILHG